MCIIKAIIYSIFGIAFLCYTVSKECYSIIHLTISGRFRYLNKIHFENFPLKTIPGSY